MTDKKTFFILWLLCIAGSLSVLPYLQYMGMISSEVSVWKAAFVGAMQAALIFGLVCWLSSKILPKTNLRPFALENPLKRIVYPALISGGLLGLILFLANKTIFATSALAVADIHLPFWIGILGSIYGAVNEEVLLRLFLFTLIYLALNKIFKRGRIEKRTILWSTNILVALIFGMGHLPAAFKLLGSLSAFEISRILFLNGIAGVVFGWLYWSRGLWTAMAAHFVTDLMIHVFLM
jgi:membrane protease YdiL (CAAX protease family)